MERMTGIGIMGGTFDPVHAGHLACAAAAADALGLAQVRFIPTGNPNFKQDLAVSAAIERAAMLHLALVETGDERFVLDTREIVRPGVTYSVDTLEELADEDPDRRLFFIMGADSAATLAHWKAASRVAELCTVVAVARPGYDFAALRETLGSGEGESRVDEGEELPGEKTGQPDEKAARTAAAPIPFTVEYLEIDTPDISSTQVRERVAAGLPVDELVPAAVVKYLWQHHLYQD